MTTSRTIASLYAVLASLAVVLLATTMPPMQNADEAAHAFRAGQVSRLGFAGQVLNDGEYGGTISSGLVSLQARTQTIPFHPSSKVTRPMFAPLAWGDPMDTGFPNTAVNPPFFYLPAALSAAMARHFGIGLPHALVLMRLATGFATVGITTAAIALAGDAAIWLFAVLLLPMSLALSAAVSQDGPLLACTALAIAVFLYLHRSDARYRPFAFAAMCVLLALVGMARAPYLAFALLPAAASVKPSWRIGGVAGILLCVIAWSASSAPHLPLPLRPDGVVSPARQLLILAGHPWRIPFLAVRTWQANNDLIARSFIGQPGWLDVELPRWYHRLAWIGLSLAAGAAWRPGRTGFSAKMIALLALAAIGAAGGVVLVQYMTWTRVGGLVVDGVQGRYFLAPALVLGVFFARPAPSATRLSAFLAMPMVVFPILGIAVVLHAVVLRYYF